MPWRKLSSNTQKEQMICLMHLHLYHAITKLLCFPIKEAKVKNLLIISKLNNPKRATNTARVSL